VSLAEKAVVVLFFLVSLVEKAMQVIFYLVSLVKETVSSVELVMRVSLPCLLGRESNAALIFLILPCLLTVVEKAVQVLFYLVSLVEKAMQVLFYLVSLVEKAVSFVE
jgi:hypothetical protein